MNSNLDQTLCENTIEDTINSLTAAFSSSLSPRLDAQVLLSHVFQKSRAWLLAHQETDISPSQQNIIAQAVAQIEKGTPLPYILGKWAFYDLDFLVTPAVLIPRPETELLVEHALKWILNHPQRRCAIDIGTGSGCIAITLAYHIPDLSVTAVDISQDALDIARKNAKRVHLESRISFVQADLFTTGGSSSESIQPPFDLIAANLPYIPTKTLRNLNVFGREPTLALDGGPDGMNLIRQFLRTSSPFLSPGGRILFEIGADQGKNGLKLAADHFPGAEIKLHPDLSGKDRLITIDT